VKDVFDLFDFWDGRDGLVDGAKIGDVMRCIGLNPTNKQILENGGTKKFGQLIHWRHIICLPNAKQIKQRRMFLDAFSRTWITDDVKFISKLLTAGAWIGFQK